MTRLISWRQPLGILILADAVIFSMLYLHKQPYDYALIPIGLIIVSLICASYLIIIRKGLGDQYLFLVVGMLASIGFAMIFRLDRAYGIKQAVWLTAGVILFFLSYWIYIKIQMWDRLLFYYMSCSVLLFSATLILGKNIKGATNWIVIGNHTFQPSEIIKILFIFSLACFFKGSQQFIHNNCRIELNWHRTVKRAAIALMAYTFIGFLILQRDWGSAMLFFMIYFVMLYIFDGGWRFLALNAGAAFIGAVGGFMMLYHIRVRVDTWLNPWPHIADKGYQITQSLFAIAAGGFFGTGLGMGKPEFIPEVSTDFIFSAICEEMGILGGVAVVLLYFILAYRGFKIALTVKDIFKKAVALGITSMFGFQTFIIIGGVIKLIPLTGITLPFISYGGSSLTASFIALGILQAISAGDYGETEEQAGEGE
ncbi:cell division protein FtsW (lipid II flippase) [Anaerobacterium chartisolvens]|uniref:Cell division protein FtsW (Lipid II flippase) n=1 Tax=Anaerobacterium chartisolvens TaxID=1297424 RepID=A0A369BBC5_9FIRM|nr:FtsW/RodA/SpoVE family cell cycle protein [Anaerobacterium chartisolvens]RCX18829.1 cell division protein FtsW (lipid II flippase) [Anaerobacterium chartisolvens]